jgi:response regulator RpfG family c-di-GMP phosphodiesterase
MTFVHNAALNRGAGTQLMHSVLVVDDEPVMRGLLTNWVETLGFEALEADSAASAVKVLDRVGAPDITLCDVQMPGESGVWFASHVRRRCPASAVVMATSGRDVDAAVSSLRNEVVDYLLKPFDRERLAEALALALEWHRAASGANQLQDALKDRLRHRRTAVAGALAEAQSSPRDALVGLLDMLQLHEPDARGHALRVSRLALAIGDDLGLPDSNLLDLERGALLHDVGKLDMPTAILRKPSPLTDREWAVMRRHPEIGHDLVHRLPGFAAAAEIVWSHHEAFDGSGYPRALAGSEISLEARILTVADSYDSMTHPHTQRPAMPPALAVSEIERCRGSQFDPDVACVLGTVLAQVAEERKLH